LTTAATNSWHSWQYVKIKAHYQVPVISVMPIIPQHTTKHVWNCKMPRQTLDWNKKSVSLYVQYNVRKKNVWLMSQNSLPAMGYILGDGS